MPKLAAVGQPVSHSRSPVMHTAALEELGLAGEWSYEAIELSPDEFPHTVRRLPEDGFAGINVTVPHKVAALELATSASPSARAIGAANTLSFTGGEIAAENTDATGILAALPGGADGRRALVLGAGGSARAAVWALAGAGAGVWIVNRTPEKARAVAAELGVGEALEPAEVDVSAFDIVLNATTIGLDAAGSAPRERVGDDPDRGLADLKALGVDADCLRAGTVLVDLVYGTVETPLAAAARARGVEVVDGLEVLVRQGAESLRIWTGMDPPIATMRRAARTR
jgi:shikimate dehydrogenase